MTKKQFYENLSATDLSTQAKFEVCKYFLKNYPVKIEKRTLSGIVNFWTKLDFPIEDSSNEIIESNFNKLVKKVNELKKFDDGMF
jgi:hypothetical protein